MEDLNIEKIQEAFNTNEELRGQILETIATNEHGKSYLDNYANGIFEQKVGTKIGEVHGLYDKDFEEVLGIKKPDGVKSYQFWKEEAKKLKELASSSDPSKFEELRKQNEELQSKIENNEQAKHFKDLYESTKKTFSEQLEEKEAMLTSFQEKQRNFAIEGELNKALTGLSLKEDIPQDVKDTYLQTIYNSLMKEAKILEDGSIAYYKDGELLTNKKTASKSTAAEILNDRLKSIISSKVDTTGGGGKDDTGYKKPSNVSFANAKTKTELSALVQESLLADGLLKGTTDFTVKFDEALAEYGTNLPLR